jgi:2-polyprenyl-3-methyl-5-hydroxy-6-metoxy-1,4-benzoquinol methylase
MNFIKSTHGRYVHQRRIAVLSDSSSQLIPPQLRVLDFGCGDGQLARRIADKHTDIRIRGIDVLRRRDTHIPVSIFDGESIPF